MSEETRCTRCGRAIERPGADCPSCLLNLALDTSSDAPSPSPEAAAADDARHRLAPGTRVGPYTIQKELGEGGMGVVYLAEQTEPIRRLAALKVLKRGMDTGQVVKRFEAERQALALMDHPAIARVHEAGETATGRPYFAMEFIDGEPVTAYCDRNRLDTAGRLRLFARICEGLQHAHQRGIIHRDIKPSNILVADGSEGPQPKIIDFGVAKATEQSLTEHSALTAIGVLLGTPEYMSPEQADLAPLDVDTRTDVYSLGVVLYELLTGALPHDARILREAAFDEVRRQIRDVRPSRPSARVSELGERAARVAQSRRAEVTTLVRRLAGDLDLITMKALEKERDRRYSSPIELAADIRRHLDNEPVLARPPSAAYLVRKLVSRHRLPAALIGGFVLLAIGFGVVMTFMYRNAQSNLERALQAEEEAARVSDFLVGVFEVSDPSEARGNSATARELLDRAAEQVDEDLADQPKMQATMMHTIGRVYRSLGLLDPAADLLTRATERREALLGPQDAAVAESLEQLARVRLTRAEFEEAERVARRALAIAEQQEDATLATLGPLDVLLNLYWQLHDYEKSLPIAENVLETTTRAYGPRSEEAAEATRSVAIITMAMDRTDDAEALFLEVVDIQEQLYEPDHPAVVNTKLNLAELYRKAARYDDAERSLLEIQEIESRIYDKKHPQRAFAFNNLGQVYKRTGRPEQAIEQFHTAIEIREAALPENHPLLAWTLDNLGLAYLDAGRLEEAAATIQRALEIALVAVGPDNGDTGIVLANLGLVRREQGRYDDAERLYRRNLEINLAVFGREHGQTADTLHNLGKTLYLKGDLGAAEKLLRESIEIGTAIRGAQHPDVGDSKGVLGLVLRDLGRHDEAEAAMRESLAAMEGALGAEHEAVVEMKRELERLSGGAR